MLMSKVICAVGAAALGAALVMVLPGFSPELQAHAGNPDLGLVVFFQAASFESQTPPPKADRIDFRPVGTACSEKAWPYFEPNCLRDRNNAMGAARPVRVIPTDRAGN
jgi:hypothetical protein